MGSKSLLKEKINKVKPIVALLLGPAIFAFIFSFTFSEAYIKDIPLVVYDRDCSKLSEQVIESLDSSQGIAVIKYANSMEEVKNMILSEKAWAALIIPENLEKDFRSGKNPSIQMMINSTNLLVGNNCLQSATTVLTTLNIGIRMQVLEGKGIDTIDAENYVQTLMFSDSTMYNPEMSYKQYLLIGIIAVTVQQLFFLFSGILFIENRQLGRRLQVFLPKVIMYILLAICGFVMAIIVLEIMGFRIVGNIIPAVLLQLFFMVAIVGSALTFSSLFKNPEHFAQFSLMLAVPTFITSTFIWPAHMMSKIMLVAIKILWPLCNFAPVVKGILQKGWEIGDIWANMAELTIFAIIWGTIGAFLYEKKRNRHSIFYGSRGKKDA